MVNDSRRIVELIRSNDRYLVTSHFNPDGDSIASQLAIRKIFQLLGKECTIVNLHPVPRIYRFLPGSESILVRQRHSQKPYSALFVLDSGHPSRASGFLRKKSPLKVVNIDHHVSNHGYGNLNWIVTKASSTCEIIYDLAVKLGVLLDGELALLLYTGILTDTGSFRYSSTSPKSMSIAARLLRHGINPHDVAEQIYENSEYSSLKLLGKSLARLGKSPDGRVTWVTYGYKELCGLSNMAETEEFVNYARSLDSARIAIGLKEVAPGDIRISFRSKGEVNVSDLASRHGGGGHRNAAGCTIKGPLAAVTRRLVAEAQRFMDEIAGE